MIRRTACWTQIKCDAQPKCDAGIHTLVAASQSLEAEVTKATDTGHSGVAFHAQCKGPGTVHILQRLLARTLLKGQHSLLMNEWSHPLGLMHGIPHVGNSSWRPHNLLDLMEGKLVIRGD